jgi:HEAT repeat protein
VELLAVALRDDEDESVRVAAASALGMLKEWASVEALLDALRDSKWRVREMAALALGGIGERVPVETLISVLQNDPDTPVREAARQALKQTHPDIFSTLPPDSMSAFDNSPPLC